MSRNEQFAKQLCSGKQAAMLVGIANARGLHGRRIFDWLEFESGLNITIYESLESELPAIMVDRVKQKLEALPFK
jgi:hypothetical protein